METRLLILLCLAGLGAAQSSSQSPSVITLNKSHGSSTGDYLPGITLPSIIQASSIATNPQPTSLASLSRASNATANLPTSSTSTSRQTSSQEPVTNIGGASRTVATTASRSRPPMPSNTQACNNYVEFCTRKYSNITEVAAHNSPFYRQNNVGRNQDYGVTQQLNDGIRVLVTQAHYINNTLYMCHTSCDLLNSGTVEDYLREVNTWLDAHPFEVITIIFGNYNWADQDANGNPLVTSTQFDQAIRSSGLISHIYQPPKNAMKRADWPTLGEMILRQKRVVTFIDHNFNTMAVPYMLWTFYNYWETPFSPTGFEFPCTLGRPEGISAAQQGDMMYLANHNLNTEMQFGSVSILVPNVAWIQQTNAAQGNGSLGSMTQQCTQMHSRPPNYLVVDFYNEGPTNGSVFHVAARANGVTYNRPCCGQPEKSAAALLKPSTAIMGVVIAIGIALMV